MFMLLQERNGRVLGMICNSYFRGTNFIDNQKRGMYEKKIS